MYVNIEVKIYTHHLKFAYNFFDAKEVEKAASHIPWPFVGVFEMKRKHTVVGVKKFILLCFVFLVVVYVKYNTFSDNCFRIICFCCFLVNERFLHETALQRRKRNDRTIIYFGMVHESALESICCSFCITDDIKAREKQ